MSPYYEIAQVSKQAYHKQVKKVSDQRDRTAYYIGLMDQARIMHPVIGLAKIYYLFNPQGIGRQSFEELGRIMGYSLENKPKMTWKGTRVIPYQNLLSDKWFTAVNQIWVTDITYYKIGDSYFYISMIMDLYARKIIAHGVADSLHAYHSLSVLKKAIRKCKPAANTLIHHSDKGTQYTCNDYIKCLDKHNISISMCNSVFENTSMERLNGIIKNDYLIHWKPKSFSHLKRLLDKAVNNYNNCPHGQLDMMSPIHYEENLKNIPLSQRTKLKVFTLKRNKKLQNPDQLKFSFNDLLINQKGQPDPV